MLLSPKGERNMTQERAWRPAVRQDAYPSCTT
jgi:hypothetical protein